MPRLWQSGQAGARGPMLSARQRERLAQRVAGAICVLLILGGASHLLNGRLDYPNWWGGWVFDPFAIGMGALGLLAVGVRRRKSGRKSK